MHARHLIREKTAAIAEWLGCHHENIAYGLRSVADAEKLYDYWQSNSHLVPENCDDEPDDPSVNVRQHRINAIGYDPLEVPLNGAKQPPKVNKSHEALIAVKTLLDSVAYVAKEGDTKRPLRLINAALETSQI